MASKQPQRPLPKAEIVINQNDPSIPQKLYITCTSRDAEIWLTQEAPLFGQFFMPDYPEFGLSVYRLFVNEAFDPDAVIRYLKTYNKGNVEGTPESVTPYIGATLAEFEEVEEDDDDDDEIHG